jgi:hypothetical protein
VKNTAHHVIAPSRDAMFSTVVDDLQVQAIPAGFGKEGFQVFFGLDTTLLSVPGT